MVMPEQTGLAGAMNARVIGSGNRTLILAHGYGANQSIWDKVVPDLSRSNRVVLFDWSFCSSVDRNSVAAFDEKRHSSYDGFADDLIGLVDEMKIGGAVYLGHSMAGMIGCIASLKRPDVFSHLLLLGASPRYLNSEDFKGGFDPADVDNIFTNITSNFHQWASAFASQVVSASDPIPTAKFAEMFRSMRPEVALSTARTVFLTDHRQILEKVEVRCTVIHCSDDVVVPMTVAEYMKEKMNREVSLEIISTGGHFPQLTVPELLIGIVDRVMGFDVSRLACELIQPSKSQDYSSDY